MCFSLGIYVDKLRYAVAHEFKYALLEEEWLQPHVWYHVCVTRNISIVSIFLQGNLLESEALKLNVKEGATNLTIGYVNPERYPMLKFIGSATQFNVWRRVLSHQDIKQIANCKKVLDGDLISWNEDAWSLRNSTIYYRSLQSFCDEKLTSETQLFHGMSYGEGAYLCEGLGGTLHIPKTHDEVSLLVRSLREENKQCQVYWIGVWDVEEEGVWSSHANGTIYDELPWTADEPNGLQFENCGGLDLEGVIDDDCTGLRFGVPM